MISSLLIEGSINAGQTQKPQDNVSTQSDDNNISLKVVSDKGTKKVAMPLWAVITAIIAFLVLIIWLVR
jgi:hypothetical protein